MFEPELAFANGVADEAAAISMRFYREGFEVMTKPDATPVTDADLAIEAMVRRRVAETFPADRVFGEEEGGSTDPMGRVWIVDPIDATKNFARHIPVWGTLLALRDGDDLKVAVVSAPALGERYAAVRGAGATMNGAPIHVSEIGSLREAHVLTGGLDLWTSEPEGASLMAILAEAGRTRGLGDFWGHVLVARGAAEAMVEPQLSLWDYAAPQLVVEEAGGRVTTLSGEPTFHGGSVLTTNGLLHDGFVARLSG